MIPQMSDVKRMSNDTIVDLATLLGIAVRDNAEMDQILRRYGFLAGAPETIRNKANHLVFRVADSTEIDEARREQIFLDLAARALSNPQGSDTSKLVASLRADGFEWNGTRVARTSGGGGAHRRTPSDGSSFAPEPFRELTQRQRDLLVTIVDAAETGRYDAEMDWSATFGGEELTLRGKNGNPDKGISDVTKTDLRAFADGGYVTLENVRHAAMTVALKQRAFRERKLLPSAVAIAQPPAAPQRTAEPAAAPTPSTTATAEETESPLVFVSYAHESPAHVTWVIKLAGELRSRGIDVRLDQWDVRLGGDLAVFMEQTVTRAKRVLLILTPEYKRKADNPEGGVGYEKTIITAELMKDLGTIKFVGVLRSGSPAESVPTFIGTRRWSDFRDDSLYAEKFEELVGDLRDEPIIRRPPLGNPSATGGGTSSGGTPPPAAPTSGGANAAASDAARFKMVIDDYAARGTPKNMIDAFTDLSREEKAELYDRAVIWKKQRPSKNNPYRTTRTSFEPTLSTHVLDREEFMVTGSPRVQMKCRTCGRMFRRHVLQANTWAIDTDGNALEDEVSERWMQEPCPGAGPGQRRP